MSSDITPYKVSVPDDEIYRLKAKLALTTFPSEIDISDDNSYGIPLKDMKRLVEAWKVFDWRKAEAKFNEMPQFTTDISVDGHEGALGIHFVHQRSDNPDSIPLLFCHGCTWESLT